MPVQKGVPAPARLFVTKDQPATNGAAGPAPNVTPAPQPPPSSGISLKEITELLRALPPQAWNVLLAPRAPPPQQAQQASMVMVASDGPAAPSTPKAPQVTEAHQALMDGLLKLPPEQRKELVLLMLDNFPWEAIVAQVPRFMSEQQAAMALAFIQQEPPKE